MGVYRCKGQRQLELTVSRSDYSTWDKICTFSPSCISEWIGTPSTTTGTMPSLSPMSTPTLALTEASSVERGRNCQSMDGRSLDRGLHLGWYIHDRGACGVVATARFTTCVGGATSRNNIFCMCIHISVWLANSWLMAMATAA